MPCQDDVRTFHSGTMAIVALADGAGSARFADTGARLAVEGVVQCLKTRFRALTRMPDLAAKQTLIQAILDRVAAEVDRTGESTHEYASTLLFAATDGKQCIAGQLGDGRIGIQTHDGTWRALALSTHGEFHNETTFVTSSNALDSFRLARFAANEVTACILMSDGAEEALFQRASGSFAPAVSSMTGWVAKYPQGVVQKALATNLHDVIRQKTRDDVSVAILSVR